jgi:Asp-tRNA(Asn)/Glu-tRNA(Gln) amidotransferase A subunit family amidase
LLCVVAATAPGVLGQALPSSPPPDFDVVERSIEDLQQAMAARQVTSRQLVDLYLARIAAYDEHGPALNAIASVNPHAREAAAALDAERASRGPRGPLHGVPVLVKDNYETMEMPTTAGSVALIGFQPGRDAFQVQRLKAAGAVILGKTNMHELAAGIYTVGSSFGQTRNPYDLDRNPGGSSGGTGAAVGANFAAAGMGSDTCGSIRNPASHNSLVGLRGTQGLASRTGIVPLSSTQDIGGPIARSIADLAILLDATVGADPADPSTSASAGHVPASYRAGLRSDALKGARVGVVRSLFGTAPEDQEVAGIVQKALDALKASGAEVLDVAIPGLDDLLRDSSMIGPDFKFDLADYLAAAPNAPVRSLGEILERGLFHTALEAQLRARNAVASRESNESRRARIKRTAIRQAVEAVFAEHQLTALAYPTLRRKPARIGDGQGGSNCQLSAHSGLPALGVPAGFSSDGLPIGMDLLGAAWSEQELLSLGYSMERAQGIRRAPFSTPALINAKPPAPRTTTVDLTALAGSVLSLVYDETASRLQYTLKPSASMERAASIWIHVGTSAAPGAARHLLFREGGALSGSIAVTAADRRDLADGRWLVRVYLRDRAGSAGDQAIAFPR